MRLGLGETAWAQPPAGAELSACAGVQMLGATHQSAVSPGATQDDGATTPATCKGKTRKSPLWAFTTASCPPSIRSRLPRPRVLARFILAFTQLAGNEVAQPLLEHPATVLFGMLT